MCSWPVGLTSNTDPTHCSKRLTSVVPSAFNPDTSPSAIAPSSLKWSSGCSFAPGLCSRAKPQDRNKILSDSDQETVWLSRPWLEILYASHQGRSLGGAKITMPNLKLEAVFESSGIPTYTFVQPVEYNRVLAALRTGRCPIVVEGPPGIGKTTALVKALDQLHLHQDALWLNAKKHLDQYLIADPSAWPSPGLVIIDDFHWLGSCIQQIIADHLKTLANAERDGTTLIIVGSTGAGESLGDLASNLNHWIDIIKFEPNPDDRVLELVERGERALNIRFNMKADIVAAASGSFCLAQILCRQACLATQITETQPQLVEISISFQAVIHRFMADVADRFRKQAAKFAAGPRLRREGRAVYLHFLKWLAEANEWAISLHREVAKHPEHHGSATQLITKGHLRRFLDKNPDLRAVLRYQPFTTILTAEDPQFVLFLRNLDWNKVAEQVGFLNIQFRSRYDFTLSFADPDEPFAKRLFELLSESELEVFYDHNELSPILTENVEGYLASICVSEATHIVVLLGPEYPKRIWASFESDRFRAQFGDHVVIPIWFTTAARGQFDESTRVEDMTFDPQHNQEEQLQEIVELLLNKIAERAAPALVSAQTKNCYVGNGKTERTGGYRAALR